MKELKNKVFYVIFSILTIFLLSILIIFNCQIYNQDKNNIKSNLMRMDNTRDKNIGKVLNNDFSRTDENIIRNEEKEPRIFMDSIVYTVMLDENFNIIDVINHTTNNITDEEIKNIAQELIKKNEKEKIHIGNLYFDNYSYSFSSNNEILIIIDNTNSKIALLETLKTSIIIFFILEIVIIIASKQLTKWIIEPVIESFKKQKQFIADASHELKTPLSVIIASSESLENSPEEKKWLNNIKNESERMNKLITDLLDMAKSENMSKEQYKIEDLSKLVEKSILTFEGLIYEKNIDLEYKLEENINFLCNGNQIKQLVEILLDNALKHSEINGNIKVDLRKEKANIILEVSNKGKEIPKDERERIFERFYRADISRNRNENRYGLGLAIAKNIVTNHNGKILVDCENGYTTFKIIFRI